MQASLKDYPGRGKQSILVTGGAGYVGSHVCKLLSAKGFVPITYDNLVYGHTHAVKWGPLVVGELDDHSKLISVIEEHRPEAVFHFAAYTYVSESVVNPAKYYRNNVVGTLGLLDVMRKTEVNTIVFSSSAATYGNAGADLIDEWTQQVATSPYGWTNS